AAGRRRIKNHLVPEYEVARVQGGRTRVMRRGTSHNGKGETMVAYRQSRHCRARLQGPMIAKDTGRGERIRTSGPCLPKTVLYQAELLPDRSGAGGPARGQGGPLDARLANFKRQSTRSAELPSLQ